MDYEFTQLDAVCPECGNEGGDGLVVNLAFGVEDGLIAQGEAICECGWRDEQQFALRLKE